MLPSEVSKTPPSSDPYEVSPNVWAALILLTLVVRAIPAWYLLPEVADVGLYRGMAETTLRSDNVYDRPIFFPYTPYSQFLPAAMMKLSDVTGWRFPFAMKLPSILFDVLVTILILMHLAPRAGPRSAAGWALLWALHPVSIMITSFHGNVMTLVPALLAAAYVALLESDRETDASIWLLISSLLLGLAIALRSFPILLLPVFVLFGVRRVGDALLYCVAAGLATAASSIPYLIYAPDEMLREVFSYSGFTDFGWVAVLRSIPLAEANKVLQFFDTGLLRQTKTIFLLAYAIIVGTMPFWRHSALQRALLIAPLLFYWIYGGVSAQYLVWVVPLAILARDRWVIPFSCAATAAMIGFYVTYHSRILFGQYPPLLQRGDLTSFLYVGGNAAVVVLAVAWTATIVLGELRQTLRRPALLPVLNRPWLRALYSVLLVGLCVAFAMQAGEAIERGLDVLRVHRMRY